VIADSVGVVSGCAPFANGSVICGPAADFERLVFHFGAGDDDLDAGALAIPLTVDGGGGNDFLAGGALGDDVACGPGDDVVYEYDDADTIYDDCETVDPPYLDGELVITGDPRVGSVLALSLPTNLGATARSSSIGSAATGPATTAAPSPGRTGRPTRRPLRTSAIASARRTRSRTPWATTGSSPPRRGSCWLPASRPRRRHRSSARPCRGRRRPRSPRHGRRSSPPSPSRSSRSASAGLWSTPAVRSAARTSGRPRRVTSRRPPEPTAGRPEPRPASRSPRARARGSPCGSAHAPTGCCWPTAS
jgi:hypothetical protein